MAILFLSGSANKIAEVQAIAATAGLEVRGVKIPDMPPEIQGSFEEIIRHKILAAVERGKNLGLIQNGDIILAEDSGIEIDMLGDMPGPYAKHFFDTKDHGISYENFIKLFPNQKIMARCLTVAGCLTNINDPDSFFSTSAVMKGYLVAKRGENGFGWDPYLVPTECEGKPLNPEGKTIGEMTAEEKNAMSTRGEAIRNVLKKLKVRLELQKEGIN